MRVLIGCREICGWISLLSQELERQGHQVVSISNRNKFYKDAVYTLEKENFERDYMRLRVKSKWLSALFFLAYKALKKISFTLLKKDLFNRLYVHANTYFYNTTDLYIHLWEGLESGDADLAKFKEKGAKIISLFVGDDIRYYPVALKEFNIHNDYFLEHTKFPIYVPMRKLRIHESYSDAIFSTPDQSSLALRPYFHFHIPLDLDSYTYTNTQNDIPVILHIPSAPLLKGSPVFEQVMQELKEEGLAFEFKSVCNIPNTEVKRLLNGADILLDELYMHGPGMLGIEAMASGCCVVVKYLENSPASFRPPVVSVSVETVKEKIKQLILNKALREDLIVKGREYVEQHNRTEQVCKSILDKVGKTDYDYYPSYFREQFQAGKEDDPKQINALTALVKQCAWYIQFVKNGKRDELVF